jgi:hypothetical protein
MSVHYSNANAFDLFPKESASNIAWVTNYSDWIFLDFLRNLQKYSEIDILDGVTIALSTYLIFRHWSTILLLGPPYSELLTTSLNKLQVEVSRNIKSNLNLLWKYSKKDESDKIYIYKVQATTNIYTQLRHTWAPRKTKWIKIKNIMK